MSVVACPVPASQPVFGVVVFDPGVFMQQYPAFAGVPTAALINNFNRATLLLNNSCFSLCADANKREMLYGLLVAHITQLTNGANGQAPSGLVGRVSGASEGSVSVQADMGTISAAAAYLMQTQYGSEFWQATAGMRAMRYVAAPQRLYSRWDGYGPIGFGNNGGRWW